MAFDVHIDYLVKRQTKIGLSISAKKKKKVFHFEQESKLYRAHFYPF